MSGLINEAGTRSGIIFKPYHAYGYWGNTASGASNSIASTTKFPATVKYETGLGVWSNSNDEFQCKISGAYRFTGNWEMGGSTDGRWGVQLRIGDGTTNGQRTNFSNSIHHFEGTGWDNANLNIIIQVNAGETVQYYSETMPSGAQYWQYGNGGWEVQWVGFSQGPT